MSTKRDAPRHPLPLSAEELEAVRDSLEAYMIELRRQTASTEARDLQRALARRLELLEEVVRRLAA